MITINAHAGTFARVALVALAVLCTGSAGAVEVAGNGVGGVLLYPYFTVRSVQKLPYDTLVIISNGTPDVKAVRLRIRDGLEGASIGEFNVYLAPYDTYTAALLPGPGGAGIASFDRSCTVPAISSDGAHPTPLILAGAAADVSASRVQEGSIEVIELGDYGPGGSAAAGSIAAATLQVNGNAPDCARVAQDTGAEAQSGSGGISGSALIINVNQGTEFAYTATALAQFNTTRPLWATPSANSPTLADATPVSTLRDASLGTIRTVWTNGVDAVSAVLMKSAINNDYEISPNTASQTEWILSFPTKWYYTHTGVSPTRLFNVAFDPAAITCEPVLPEVTYGMLHSRESQTLVYPSYIDMPFPSPRLLCSAVDSIVFNFNNPPPADSLFNSASAYQSPSRPSVTYQFSSPFALEGWLGLLMNSPPNLPAYQGGPELSHTLTGGATTILKPDGTVVQQPSAIYYGLPVIGFSAITYSNGTLTAPAGPVLSVYTDVETHRGTVQVQ